MSSPRLLLVGGGHAMLPALRAAAGWTREGADVTLLSDHPYLYYSGMVPEYVGGVYRQEQVRVDLGALCDGSGVRFVQGTATTLDPGERVVRTPAGQHLAFDVAAFDVGARNPGEAHGAIRTKPIHRLTALVAFRDRVLGGQGAPASLVIAGGGAAGTEIALNLSAHALRPGALRITIAEPANTLLPGFPPGMRAYLSHLLATRGVDIRTRTGVEERMDGYVRLTDGTEIEADEVLWSTGNVGQDLFRAAGLPCDERGYVRVEQTLQVRGHPSILAAGDCALVAGHENLARIGVHAVRQGRTLAHNLGVLLHAPRAQDAGTGLRPFHPYPVAPLILSTGIAEGVWTAGPAWMRGRPLLRLKHFVDQRWMRKYNDEAWGARPAWMMFDAHAAATCV